jgi:6,7-dimethyl-8-ribityllumazine synthase
MSLSAPQPISTSGAGLRIGIAAARFNQKLVDGLIARATQAMVTAGVAVADLEIVRVPGSHEVPWAAQALAQTGRFDCVIGLGVLIAGDTNHHEMVGESVSHALQQVALATGTPIINGVIVVNSLAQAEERCVGSINRGAEFASAAIEMAVLKKRFSR